MDSLQLSGLSVSSTEQGVVFSWQGEDKHAVTLPDHQIETLRAFLEARTKKSERRIGFRVPLQPLSQEMRDAFAVTLKHYATRAEAIAVDLSLTGILVSVADLQLKTSDQIVVQLRLGDDQTSLNANVVRQQGKLVALHFPTCIDNGELDPPDALLNIYRALEHEWLRSRVHD